MTRKKVVSFSGKNKQGWYRRTGRDGGRWGLKKGRQFFQEKIEGWHPQLPPWVSPTLVTPLSRRQHHWVNVIISQLIGCTLSNTFTHTHRQTDTHSHTHRETER